MSAHGIGWLGDHQKYRNLMGLPSVCLRMLFPIFRPQILIGNMASQILLPKVFEEIWFLILIFMNVPILSNFHSICLARSPHWLTGKLAGNPNSWWDTLDTCLNKPANCPWKNSKMTRLWSFCLAPGRLWTGCWKQQTGRFFLRSLAQGRGVGKGWWLCGSLVRDLLIFVWLWHQYT